MSLSGQRGSCDQFFFFFLGSAVVIVNTCQEENTTCVFRPCIVAWPPYICSHLELSISKLHYLHSSTADGYGESSCDAACASSTPAPRTSRRRLWLRLAADQQEKLP
jgi:hypothetical protein